MKNSSKLFVVTSCAVAVGILTPLTAHAGPMGPSAKMAARLKKRPTSVWLAHYLPDDRYKIAGGVWKFVSTDLDTYYHRPDSPLMMNQPAGRVIGFSSVAEAEEAGYRPDPNLGSFGSMDMMSSDAPASTSMRRVILADGVSSLSLPQGWKKTAARIQKSQYVNSTTEGFLGPKGERFEVSTLIVNAPAANASTMASMDMSKLINLRFYTQLKANMKNMAGNLNQMGQTSGAVNSQMSGQNMISALSRLNEVQLSRVVMSGIEGVASINAKAANGQPKRSYSVGKGNKILSVSDYSPRSTSIAPILKSVRLR